MNDFSELEAELKKLRPAPVSLEFAARIARDLAQPDPAPTAGFLPPPRRRLNLWSLGLGLAGATALVLLGVGKFSQMPTSSSSPVVAQETETGTTEPSSLQRERALAEGAGANPGLQPSRLTRVVFHRRDEGLVFSPNQSERPLRRVRFETRDTMQWRDPQTGASFRVTYPAEQVVLTPVSFQ